MNIESKTERYYYLRDPFDGSVGCVCILRDPKTGEFHRGISLCNLKEDHFNKKRARGLAYSRAIKARIDVDLTGNCEGGKIENVGDDVLEKALNIQMDYEIPLVTGHSLILEFCNCELTSFEQRMWDDVLNPYDYNPEK